MFNFSHKKKKDTETVAETIYGWMRMLTDYIICIYIVLIVAVMPFYFTQGYGYIATDKATFFDNISVYVGKTLLPVLILYLLSAVAVYWGKFKVNKPSATDIFVGLYGVAVIISFLCSEYQESALWGANGWYMGFYPQMILVLSYFLISRFWKPRKNLFYLLFPASAVVFLLGYLNRFSVFPIEMAYRGRDYISTIGNINWYCGYVVTVFFAGVGLFWQGAAAKLWQRVLLVLYVGVGFATLVTQGSASGILTLGVMMLVLFCLSAKDGEKMCRFWAITLLLSTTCLFSKILRDIAPESLNYQDEILNLLTTGWLPVIMTLVSCSALVWIRQTVNKGTYHKKFFQGLAVALVTLIACVALAAIVMIAVNTAHPGSIGILSEQAVFTFSDTWGSKRGATWRAGIMCFLEQDFLHKLVGVGPDAMAAYIRSGGSENLQSVVEKTFGAGMILTNAHNEWLTVLINTGILGLISFVGIMISAIRTFIKESGKHLLACTCAFSVLAYTVNNILSFQQTMNVATVFIILAMGKAFINEKKRVG